MREKEMDPKLKNALDELQSVPPRDPDAAARGKAHFMRQAAVLRSAVSRKQEARHRGWIDTFFPAFPRKERNPVLNTLIAVVLAVTVFFGGTGATVYAAQESLPDQDLYPVKIWSEDAILALTSSPQAHLNYELDFSDRRITEMAGLIFTGDSIPERVVTRLQTELEHALELAAGMDDLQMVQQLEQLRLRAETQLQTMSALMYGAPESAQPALLRVQARIQEQVQLCALGQADPQGFRLQVQQRQRDRGGPGEGTPEPGSNSQTPAGTPMPTGSGNGAGPGGNQPTEMPGQYGPGSQSAATHDSGNGSGGHKP